MDAASTLLLIECSGVKGDFTVHDMNVIVKCHFLTDTINAAHLYDKTNAAH